ncbi:thioesterase II family protein [Oerskovia sp. Root918]|uniref:thioesterase II family protein n=1 Tax=Oerskovia sp. Root918 TaxID=1736607 RepID=UPI000A4C0337|nr:alpha/beta fold hydrolase [Oerskovia sp. Root918]
MTDGPRPRHPALRVLASPAGATWRVVVCPHAGGAASYYRRLVGAPDALGDSGAPDAPGSAAGAGAAVPPPTGPFATSPEVVAVQYPGRESRFGEPLARTMTDLLADVSGPVRGLLADGVPTVLLGHSLGASVAARIAAGLGPDTAPDLLVVSGRAARADRPGTAGDAEEGSDVVGPGPAARDEAALRAWITALGGTPPELLADDEFFALRARVLRADLAVHDSLAATPGEPADVTVPLLLLAGSDDVASPPASVAPWAARARAGVRQRVVEGGHFFVGERPDEVIEALRVALTAAVAGTCAADAARPSAEDRWVWSREAVASTGAGS